MRTIEARYDGRCGTCYGQVKAGETVGYDGKVHHEACVARAEALRQAAAEQLAKTDAAEVAGVLVAEYVVSGERVTVLLGEEGPIGDSPFSELYHQVYGLGADKGAFGHWGKVGPGVAQWAAAIRG